MMKEVHSFDTLITQLETLEKILPEQLDQFVTFNKAYLIITSAIQSAARTGYFKNPEFIEKFTVGFARYYFTAIDQTLAHDPGLPEAWQLVSKAKKGRGTPEFILLLMGANAHINHDLPLTLNMLIKNQRGSGLLKDVLKIDKLLLISGKQILQTFDERNRGIDLFKRRLVFLYYYPAMWLILYWRIKAWRNYRKIEKLGVDASKYQATSIRTAKRFLKFVSNNSSRN